MQASQVYYCTYPSLRRNKLDWWAVCKIKAKSNVEVPESSISTEESLIPAPLQEETTDNHDLVQIDEDPLHLDDPSCGVIEPDGEHSDIEDEIELEEEINYSSRDSMTRGGSRAGRIRGHGRGALVTPLVEPPPNVVSPPIVSPASIGSPAALPIPSPSNSTAPPTSSSVVGSFIGCDLPIIHVEDGKPDVKAKFEQQRKNWDVLDIPEGLDQLLSTITNWHPHLATGIVVIHLPPHNFIKMQWKEMLNQQLETMRAEMEAKLQAEINQMQAQITSLMDELRRNGMLSTSMPPPLNTQAEHSVNSNDENLGDD
nr:uncharacterized protein LOC109179592 [Ipomoea batatas]